MYSTLFSGDPGFDQKKVRGNGKTINIFTGYGIWLLPGERGLAKIWAWDAGFFTCLLGIREIVTAQINVLAGQNRYSRFSPVMWWKLKIVTIQWIKSRIWDTIDDWYINNLAKNQVFAVFHSCVICRKCVTQIYRALYGDAMLCPSEGHKYGGGNVTETSVTEFCYWNEKFWL